MALQNQGGGKKDHKPVVDSHFNKVDKTESPKQGNEPNTPVKGAGDLKNSTSCKQKNNSEDILEQVSKKQKESPFMEGVTVKHGKDSMVTFVCTITKNRDHFNHTQSFSEEESEPDSGDPEAQILPFQSTDEFSSPVAKKKDATLLSANTAEKKNRKKRRGR